MRTRTGANMNTLEKYFQTSTSSSEYVRNYLSYLSELVLKLDRDEIVKVINLFLDARQSGNTIFFIGNAKIIPPPDLISFFSASYVRPIILSKKYLK